MKRIVSPNGSQINFEKTVNDIQDAAFLNLKKRVEEFIEASGINLSVINGVLGDEFELSFISSNEKINVNNGKALTSSGDYLKIDTNLSIDNPTVSQLNNPYAIILEYKEASSNPVKALNAFVFDALGSKSLNRKTVYSDSIELLTQEYTEPLLDFKAALPPNQILLGIVWNDSGTFSGIEDFPIISSGNYRIADLREESRLLLNSNLLSDKIFLYKDRPSVGSNSFSHNIEFSGDLYFNEIKPSSSGEGIIRSNSIQMESGNLRKTNIEGTTAQDFYVRVGSGGTGGRKLIISDGALTTPENLRVFEITPSNDRLSKTSLVTIKWNWDGLQGPVEAGNNQITISSSTIDDESVSFTNSIIGKDLYFSSSTNRYEIVARSGNTITLASAPVAEDAVGPSDPMRIIDKNVSQYILTVRDKYTNEAHIALLDRTFVTRPVITKKLELGETYRVSLQALNQGGSSNTATTGDFLNSISQIDETGNMTLRSDAQGFLIETTGWNSAHEFEVVYSSKADLSEVSDPFNANGGDIEKTYMETNIKHISSGRPTRYYVALRPLQNKYPVGDHVVKEIVSGGGGLLPDEDVLIQTEVNVQVVTGKVKEIIQEPEKHPELEIAWEDENGQHITVDDYFANGRYFTPLDGSLPQFAQNVHARAVRKLATALKLNEGRQRIVIEETPPPIITTETVVKSGISREDRLIAERELTFDYVVTGIQLKLKSVHNLSPTNSGIIRVYQRGSEMAATKMEVEGFSEEPIKQAANLPINLSSNGTRTLVVDAWDNDSNEEQANNNCNIAGTITVLGRPRIVDNF